MDLAHETDGVEIWKIVNNDGEFVGCGIRRIDLLNCEYSSLLKIQDWCLNNHRAYYITSIFENRFGGNLTGVHISLKDLDLIIETFAGKPVAEKAAKAKENYVKALGVEESAKN